MKWYVIASTDNPSGFDVIGAAGFVPDGVVCEAPDGAEPDDGPYVQVVNGVASFNEEARALKPKPSRPVR